MGFFISTVLVSGLVIFLGASLLQWILGKIIPRSMAGPSHATSVAVVAVVTVVYMYVMTRPSIVGPYEQWTFANIGGQVTAGALVAGFKVWTGRKGEA